MDPEVVEDVIEVIPSMEVSPGLKEEG